MAALLEALRQGRGQMAQFDIPSLGAPGQWMRGGMTMVGDWGDGTLKAKVDALCRALQAEAGLPGQAGDGGAREEEQSGSPGWWPAAYQSPAATGGQNDFRYAYFSQDEALVVEEKWRVVVYDTAGHKLHGFSQSQPGSTWRPCPARRNPCDSKRAPYDFGNWAMKASGPPSL